MHDQQQPPPAPALGELDQSPNVLAMVFENAPDAELLVDHKGRIVEFACLEAGAEACLSLESSDAQEH